MKIDFTNKDGKKVLIIDESDDSITVLHESLKEMTKEERVTDKIEENKENKNEE